MIEVHKEPPHVQAQFRRVMECCTFCRTPTPFWDASKRHPVCPLCAEKHDDCELHGPDGLQGKPT